VNGKAVWTGKLALAPEHILLEPLKRRKPTTWFVNSMSDLFHEDVPDEWIDKVRAVMALTPHHTYQVLTKRSGRMRAHMAERLPPVAHMEALCEIAKPPTECDWNGDWPLENFWVGVSCERQQEADQRIPDLLATPAAVRFVSLEPLLGPIDLSQIALHSDPELVTWTDALRGSRHRSERSPTWTGKLDWVICGGESGRDARPMHPDWARSLRDQCTAAAVPFFFKQHGAWALADRGETDLIWMAEDGWLHAANGMYDPPHRVHRAASWALLRRVGKKAAGRLLDGREWNEMPRAPGADPAGLTPSLQPTEVP
jgi:protein gp37